MTILDALKINHARDDRLKDAVDAALLTACDHVILAMETAGHPRVPMNGNPLVGIIILLADGTKIDVAPALRVAATEAIASYSRADPTPRSFLQRLGDAIISRIARKP